MWLPNGTAKRFGVRQCSAALRRRRGCSQAVQCLQAESEPLRQIRKRRSTGALQNLAAILSMYEEWQRLGLRASLLAATKPGAVRMPSS